MKRMVFRLGAFVSAAAVALAVIGPVQPAAASGGNVQVRVFSTSGVQITRASVQGKNQNGKDATWGAYDTGSTEVKTTGWWFGGSGTASYVTVRFRLANGVTMSCFQALNIYPWENWKTIEVNSSGYTTSSGAPSGQCGRISSV